MPTKPTAQATENPVEQAHASWWTDRRITMFALAVGVLMGGFGAVVTTSLYVGRDNGDVLERVDETSRIIKDSVDPGGVRFQRGQQSTAAAVGGINEISVLAAYCSHQHQDLAAIEGCVRAEYARAHPPTTTTTR